MKMDNLLWAPEPQKLPEPPEPGEIDSAKDEFRYKSELKRYQEISESWRSMHEETSKTIRRVFYALVGTCLFCFLTLTGTPDVQLLTPESTVTLPILNYKMGFEAFLVVGPAVLIALCVYLHIFVAQHRRYPIPPESRQPMLSNFDSWAAKLSVLVIFYWLVPTTLAVFTWKAWPRPIGPHLLYTTIGVTAVLVALQIRRSPGQWRTWSLPLLGALFVVYSFGIFQATNDRKLNLFKANLVGADLRRVNLAGSFLDEAELEKAKLSGANLDGARLHRAKLREADLSFANLHGAKLRNADLRSADLSSADLSSADVSGADLYGANLFQSNLSRADLSNHDLSESNLSEANLSGADLRGHDLSSHDLTGANLSRANLSGANLRGRDLSSNDLSGANLSRANLSRANLIEANFRGANLSGANLSNADLRRAGLRVTDMTSANLSGADLRGANLSSANLNRANLSGANASWGVISESDLMGACGDGQTKLKEGLKIPPCQGPTPKSTDD